ncbi:MAG: hypothetical protein K6F57_03785 [Candidatus Saccharibacteria bacterium]|nr:hypothetical protein [Candidatus Saccharibacteria bacterium]
MEYLDIVDEQGNKTGEVLDKRYIPGKWASLAGHVDSGEEIDNNPTVIRADRVYLLERLKKV